MFDAEPGIDVGCEESVATLVGWEMPHFVDANNFVALPHGFHQFGSAPRTTENAIGIVMVALMRAFEQGFGHLFGHAGTTEGKSEFTTTAMRQDGMIETTRSEHIHLGQTEVVGDVLILRMGDDGGMPNGVLIVLVDCRIQRSNVDITYFFALGFVCHVVKGDRIGPPTEEGVSWFQGWYEGQVRQEGLELRVGLHQLVPLTFPHDT